MIQHKRILKSLSLVVSLSGMIIFSIDAIPEEKVISLKQLSAEEMEIVQMIDLLENYGLLKRMDMFEKMEVREQNISGKDLNKKIDNQKGGEH